MHNCIALDSIFTLLYILVYLTSSVIKLQINKPLTIKCRSMHSLNYNTMDLAGLPLSVWIFPIQHRLGKIISKQSEPRKVFLNAAILNVQLMQLPLLWLLRDILLVEKDPPSVEDIDNLCQNRVGKGYKWNFSTPACAKGSCQVKKNTKSEKIFPKKNLVGPPTSEFFSYFFFNLTIPLTPHSFS